MNGFLLTKYKSEWKDFINLADRAAEQSIGRRGRLSALLYSSSRYRVIVPPEGDILEHFGYNHIPNSPETPLEYIGVKGEFDYQDRIEFIPETVDGLKSYSVDQMGSKRDVMHAETHAILKSISSDLHVKGQRDVSVLYVSQSPCIDCAKNISKYLDVITIIIKKLFRDSEGLQYLIDNSNVQEICILEDDGTMIMFKVGGKYEISLIDEINKYLASKEI